MVPSFIVSAFRSAVLREMRWRVNDLLLDLRTTPAPEIGAEWRAGWDFLVVFLVRAILVAEVDVEVWDDVW